MLKVDARDKGYIGGNESTLMVYLYSLLMCDLHGMCLLADDALASFSHLFRIRNASLITIENGRDLFECVASCLGVIEVCSHAIRDNDGDVHNVVLPADCIEGDWIHKGVEADCNSDCNTDDGKTTRSEMVWPDLARVGCHQRRTDADIRLHFDATKRMNLQRYVITGEEDEQERDDSKSHW